MASTALQRRIPGTKWPWWYAGVAAGVLGGAWLLWWRGGTKKAACTYPDPGPEPKDAPLATGVACPTWPVVTDHPDALVVPYRDEFGQQHGRPARSFGAKRPISKESSSPLPRLHAGMDLFAYAGDMVVATEAGEVVRIYHFTGGTYVMVVQGDSGLVQLYGEIAKDSWEGYGVEVGSHVSQGQAIADVGLISSGAHMLHFETYSAGATKNERWYPSEGTPPKLRNPTDYLLRARLDA